MPEKLPHSVPMEEALLGAALLSAAAAEVLVTDIEPGVFFTPSNMLIATAIAELWRSGQRVEPAMVAEWLRSQGMLERAGGAAKLNALQAGAPSTAGAASYARVLVEHHTRRRVILAADALIGHARDLARPLDAVVDEAETLMAGVDLPVDSEGEDPTLDEFVAQDLDYDWLVPGLIERGDRFILTGEEGFGKSTWCRQVGVQLGIGIHPWTEARIRPIRVLIVDLENSPSQVHRNLRSLAVSVKASHQLRLGQEDEGIVVGGLRIRCRPQGLDLLRAVDRHWLTARVEANRPDLLITGPLYKLHSGKPADEEPAAHVAAYLDDLRVRYGLAIMLEGHSPHASDGNNRTLRPYGASLWMRWPEFGFGLRQAKDDTAVAELVSWRGPRDRDREWPYRLRRGGRWPWTNGNAKATEDF